MKSQYILLICCIFLSSGWKAQINSTYLSHNNVSVFLSDAGTYFYNYDASEPGYEVPKGFEIRPIYLSQFWFGGKDANDSIHLVIGGYPGYGSDVFNGPASAPFSYDTPTYQTQWGNSMWSICQSEIDQFKNWWACENGLISAGCNSIILTPEIEMKINSWPAHGDVSIGQSYWLAPFFDYNADGNYNPIDGDYPLIKGCCATYMIQNDMANFHIYSGTDPIGLELHMMFYQYHTSDYLDNATFIDVTAINRGNTSYPDFAHGIMVDADLGSYIDDFMGCDTTKNIMYFYNGDNQDETFMDGYGLNPPALGIVGLEEQFTTSAPYIAGGSASGNVTLETWDILQGLQSYGAPWLDTQGLPTKFVYSGNPTDTTAWSEITSLNNAGDRRGIAATAIQNFEPGDTITQTYAIIYVRNGNHLENANQIIDLAADVKTFYDTQSHIACQSNGIWNTQELSSLDFLITPNPTLGLIHISAAEQHIQKVQLLNAQGKKVFEIDTKTYDTITLDLSKYPKGIYFIDLQTDKGSAIEKLVLE